MNHCSHEMSYLRLLLDDRDRQRVGRKTGDEHAAGDETHRQRGIEQVGAHQTRRAAFALRPGGQDQRPDTSVQLRDVADDRINRSGAARRGGRRERRERQIRKGHGIAKPECPMAEQPHQMQGNATAQPGLRVADREHEGGEDQPDDRVAEAAQRPLRRCRGRGTHQPEHGGSKDTGQAERGGRNRLGDDQRDDGDEQREVVPRCRRQPFRDRDERNRTAEEKRPDDTGDHVDRGRARGRRRRRDDRHRRGSLAPVAAVGSADRVECAITNRGDARRPAGSTTGRPPRGTARRR